MPDLPEEALDESNTQHRPFKVSDRKPISEHITNHFIPAYSNERLVRKCTPHLSTALNHHVPGHRMCSSPLPTRSSNNQRPLLSSLSVQMIRSHLVCARFRVENPSLRPPHPPIHKRSTIPVPSPAQHSHATILEHTWINCSRFWRRTAHL